LSRRPSTLALLDDLVAQRIDQEARIEFMTNGAKKFFKAQNRMRG
jgi:hypothetical protein